MQPRSIIGSRTDQVAPSSPKINRRSSLDVIGICLRDSNVLGVQESPSSADCGKNMALIDCEVGMVILSHGMPLGSRPA